MRVDYWAMRGTHDFLTESTVRAALTYEALIPVMERTLIDFSAGRIVQPVRTSIPVPGGEGVLALMPAVYGDVMGVKLLTYNAANAARGLPVYFTTVHLFRAATGEPLAIMDGTALTEMRTAAVSAAAVKLLAKRDARVLAVLGSGVQARAHVAALRVVRPFTDLRIWSRTPSNAEALARDAGGTSMDAERAVRGADVIVTATGAAEPVLRGAWLAEGALVLAIGSFGVDRRELDDDAMRGAVVVDSRAGASVEAGEIARTGAEIHAELGELLAGTKSLPPARHIVFKSLGLAAEDVAAAKLVWETLRPA